MLQSIGFKVSDMTERLNNNNKYNTIKIFIVFLKTMKVK